MCELARIAVKVGAEDCVQLSDRRVAAVLIEEVLSELGELTLVANEAFEGCWHHAPFGGEVLPEDLFHLCGCLLIGIGGVVQELIEGAAHMININRAARTLQGHQANAKRTFNRLWSLFW